MKKRKKRLRPRGACYSPSILSVGCSQGWPLFSRPWAAELFLLFYFPRPALLVVWGQRERETECVCVCVYMCVCSFPCPCASVSLILTSCSPPAPIPGVMIQVSGQMERSQFTPPPHLFLSIQIAKVHLGTHHVPAPTLCHHV